MSKYGTIEDALQEAVDNFIDAHGFEVSQSDVNKYIDRSFIEKCADPEEDLTMEEGLDGLVNFLCKKHRLDDFELEDFVYDSLNEYEDLDDIIQQFIETIVEYA